MKILKVVPQGKGYDVYMEGTDMVAHLHTKEEIEGLKKAGFIKKVKPIKKK